MKPRKIKVEGFDMGYRRNTGAKLRLNGRWLREAGFEPGQAVTVTVVSPGVLDVRVKGASAIDGEYLIAADRLDVALAKWKAQGGAS